MDPSEERLFINIIVEKVRKLDSRLGRFEKMLTPSLTSGEIKVKLTNGTLTLPDSFPIRYKHSESTIREDDYLDIAATFEPDPDRTLKKI